MDSSKLSFKLFLENPSAYAPAEQFVSVFHSFIQTHALDEHLLIDVADYAHVHHGPGIALISQQANLYAENFGGRPGLTYQRKQPIDGAFPQRVRTVLSYTLQAAGLLEAAPALEGRIGFRTDQLQFRIHDRRHAPNNSETFTAVRDELVQVIADTYGSSDVTLEYRPSDAELFEVSIAAPRVRLTRLLERLRGPMAMTS